VPGAMWKIHRGAALLALGLAVAGPLIYLDRESSGVEMTATPLPWHGGALVRVRVVNRDARRHAWLRAVDLSRSFVAGGRTFGATSSEVPEAIGESLRFSRDDDLPPGAAVSVDLHVVWGPAPSLRAGFVDAVFEDTSSRRVAIELAPPAPGAGPGR